MSVRQGFWYSNAAVAAGPAAVRLPHWAGVLDFSVTIEDLAPAAPEPAPEPAAQEESGGGWGCAALPRELSAPRTAAVGCLHLWAWTRDEARAALAHLPSVSVCRSWGSAWSMASSVASGVAANIIGDESAQDDDPMAALRAVAADRLQSNAAEGGGNAAPNTPRTDGE